MPAPYLCYQVPRKEDAVLEGGRVGPSEHPAGPNAVEGLSGLVLLGANAGGLIDCGHLQQQQLPLAGAYNPSACQLPVSQAPVSQHPLSLDYQVATQGARHICGRM